MRDAEAVTFATGGIDRASHLRADPAQAGLLADPGALCLALWRGQPLLDTGAATRLAWLSMTHPVFAGTDASPVFLGVEAGTPRFARAIPDWPGATPADAARPFDDPGRAAPPGLPPEVAFGDLRAQMAALSPSEAGDAAAAKGILGWHETHRFCARCGAPSEVADAGWRRSCPNCGAQHFPRTDPVVIMLILHGNSVLLGRSPAWPPGMYSLLAGFMEPGESIEAAVRREVFEEAGVPRRPGRLSLQPTLALPVQPDDRLPRRGAGPRDHPRSGRARGRPLGQPRGRARRSLRQQPRPAPGPPRLDRALPDRALAGRPPRLKARTVSD